MRVNVVAFARLREILGTASQSIDFPAGATVETVWTQLAHVYPELKQLMESTRFARNGRLVYRSEPIAEGDEVALLPPVGGG